MPASELFKWRLESAQKYDDAERSLGDVLDVKASIALVAVTFLAGVSGELLRMQGLGLVWTRAQLLVQLVALLLLSSAGATIVSELWPSGYALLPTPKEDSEWIEKLSAESHDEAAVLDKVLTYKLTTAIGRVERNKIINERKLKLLGQMFRLLAAALVLVLGNLVFLAVRAAWPILSLSLKCR